MPVIVTREWLTDKLIELKSLLWCFDTPDGCSHIMAASDEITKALIMVTGLGMEEVSNLLVDRLLAGKSGREAFYDEYKIPFASVNSCIQLQTNA